MNIFGETFPNSNHNLKQPISSTIKEHLKPLFLNIKQDRLSDRDKSKNNDFGQQLYFKTKR